MQQYSYLDIDQHRARENDPATQHRRAFEAAHRAKSRARRRQWAQRITALILDRLRAHRPEY